MIKILSAIFICFTVTYCSASYLPFKGIESTTNTTTAPLAAGATFYGGGEQNFYDHVGVMCKGDNSGTLYFDFSRDGTNWDSTFPPSGFKVSSGTAEFHTGIKLGRYFRVRFANDTTAQTYLRLTTYYGNNFVPSNAPMNQNIGIDQDAIIVRSTLPQDEIRIGRRTGVVGWTKFGYRNDLTAANGEETVWASTGNFVPLITSSTFNISYTAASDGSTSAGARVLTFWYVNDSGLPTVATHALGSSGNDTTSFGGFGINRVAVSSSGATETNGANIRISTVGGGNIQALVPAGEGVTQQSIFSMDQIMILLLNSCL